MMWTFLLGLVACSAVVTHCYTCPENNTSVYFVAATENCTVYYYCDGLELKKFSCSEGDAFDIHTEECRDASDVACFETTLLRQKISELKIHSISIDDLLSVFRKVKSTLKSNLETSIEEFASSIRANLMEKYIPFVLNIQEEIMPLVKEEILPFIKTTVSYAKEMSFRVADKIHHSIELSNSTHINAVSFSDVMSDVSKHAEPFLRLGKFFSNKSLHGGRVKRQAHYKQQGMSLPEAFMAYIDPIIAGFIPEARNMMIGNEYTVKNKVILPIVFDMLQDRETRRDLTRIFLAAKNSFAPLAFDMLMKQTFGSPNGSVVELSKDLVRAAKTKFDSEAEPLLVKVSQKYLPVILERCSEHVPLIVESVENLKKSASPYIPELKIRLRNFVQKHGSLFLNSTSTHVRTYSLMEIKSDLKPVGRILLEIFMEKMSREPNTFLSSFFNRNSFLYSVLTAGEPQIIPNKLSTSSGLPILEHFKIAFKH